MTERISFPGYRLGRTPTPPERLARNFKLASYLPSVLPPVPTGTIDVSEGIDSWPMYMNDRLGDCACAAPAHMEMIFSKTTGGTKVPTDDEVLALYELQGYQPGNPASDQGSNMGNVLSNWRNGQWSASSIYAYCQVDQKIMDHVRLALYLFRGLYIGAGLPITAQGQEVWDVVPGAQQSQSAPYSWGGHAINVVAINEDTTIDIISWGKRMKMTQNFWYTYVDEVYPVVTKDLKEGSTLEDNGFNVEQLEADMAELSR